MKNLLYCFLLLFCFACNNDKTTSETTSPAKKELPSATPQNLRYPPLPLEKVKFLFENCDYIDYLFYTLPISMSLNEQPTIQYAVSHIGQNAASINDACKAIGRIFYQIAGDNVAEADIFFQEGCTYLLFYEDGKKAFANQLTDEGIKYLNNNIKQAQQMQQQMQTN